MIKIDSKVAIRNDTTPEEITLLESVALKTDFQAVWNKLVSKGLITKTYDANNQPDGWRVTGKGNELITTVLLSTAPVKETVDKSLEKLAEELKEIFPKGKKPGTNYYWTEGKALIIRRLNIFFRKYGKKDYGLILKAARNYVESFDGNYQYMRLLKYFIFKETTGANGEIEGNSELLSCIEHEGETNVYNSDWTTELR